MVWISLLEILSLHWVKYVVFPLYGLPVVVYFLIHCYEKFFHPVRFRYQNI